MLRRRWYLPVPRRERLTVVVGEPLHVPKNPNPTQVRLILSNAQLWTVPTQSIRSNCSLLASLD